jgi:hypothetical protein
MAKLLDVVALKADRQDAGLMAGAEGVIVEDFADAYMIEFLDSEGYTVALETIPSSDVVLVWEAPNQAKSA